MSIPVPAHLVEAFKSDPDLEQTWLEQLDEYPNLGNTAWTYEQVEDIEMAHEAHYDSCYDCQSGVEFSHGLQGENFEMGYCPEGIKTMNAYLDAEQEYSWQIDFGSK